MTAHADPASPPTLWTRGRRPISGPTRRLSGQHDGTTVVGVALLCSALAAQVLFADRLAQVATAIAIGGILLGIPHGAVDHMVPFWSGARMATPSALIRVFASYLLITALAAGALLAWPTVTVCGFLLVSALHFGRGEVVFATERAGYPAAHPVHDTIVALAHGMGVVLFPLMLWPAQAATVIGVIAPRLAGRPPSWTVGATVAAVAVLAAMASWTLVSDGRTRQAAELALVLVVFAFVPPLVAFGVYFGGWHALRHTARLLALPGPDGRRLGGRAALRRYLRHAAAPTAVAVAALWVVGRIASQSALPVAIAVLLALTFPHLRTVAQLDRAVARRNSDRADPSRRRRVTVAVPSDGL